MNNDNIQKLINQINKVTALEYNDNILVFKDNIDYAINKVRHRLGILQTLKAEIDYQITISHAED